MDAIDCRFPFGERAAAIALLDEGCRISANAAFALVDEIVRPPRGCEASRDLRQEFLAYVFERFTHPLTSVLRPLAEQLVAGHESTADEALQMMRKVAEYPGQYAALCIVYFSAHDPREDLDREDDAIRRSWAVQLGHAADRPQAAGG
ncbi:MAG: hypothetical protein JNM25_15885 [Planctomycetes bacterium]|nr:hypothetical protein [Planctomycetota bacterium]